MIPLSSLQAPGVTTESAGLPISSHHCSLIITNRRVHAPESPQPYFPQEQRRSPAFPPDSATHEPINADTLIDYIRDFNEKHQSKLHIWAHVPRQDALDPPVTLRFSIPDVLLAFLSLNYSQVDRSVIVETISIFGPREKV
jgi:hypothetical protein